ncbi:hypothetical protein BGZ57DRAFT_119157 [Hyaloscypha finlandica]|nr:hypothetical protein BGZ57DRAFT_119157 [Hyaloscypha finlandica]
MTTFTALFALGLIFFSTSSSRQEIFLATIGPFLCGYGCLCSEPGCSTVEWATQERNGSPNRSHNLFKELRRRFIIEGQDRKILLIEIPLFEHLPIEHRNLSSPITLCTKTNASNYAYRVAATPKSHTQY